MNMNGCIYHANQGAPRSRNTPATLLSVFADGNAWRAGARVGVAPKSKPDTGSDALFEKVGVVASIERDRRGRMSLALQGKQQPGMYHGATRQIDQQFLFRIDQVEPFLEDCA